MNEKMSEYIQKRNRRTTLRLVKYFSVNLKKTSIALLLALVFNFATIVQPLVIMYVIDNYLAPGIYNSTTIALLAFLYLFVALIANGTGYMQIQVLRSLGQEILHKIRTDLFGHIQTMNMKFFDNNSSGRILTRVTSDVESLSDLYTDVFIMFIREAILILGMLITMFVLDPVMALWCLILVPVVLVMTVIYRLLARRNSIKVKTLLSKINGYLAENIIGMRIIQIFNREQYKFDTFDEMNEEYYRLGLIEMLINGLGNPFIVMISNLMVAFLIAAFHGSVTGGLIEIGVLFAFATYVRQLFTPIAQLADHLTVAQSALISADRIFDILDNNDDVEDLQAGSRLKNIMGSIEFKDVWFAYKDENWVLKNVSFTITPGTHAAFVGATGCGKTTIMNLISRFYEIQKGQILIDGIDSKKINLHSLRQNIAIVIQDVFLFSGDIRYNIRLNNLELKNRDIEEAAKTANCHEMILALKEGYLHQVAERGSDLSLGQRQLISFARAVVAKPSLLILDEATANIDSDTELALQSGLNNYAQGKTLLVIAHRISTIVNSDIIFVMDKGEIIEHGSHEALMKKDNGHYRTLYELSIV